MKTRQVISQGEVAGFSWSSSWRVYDRPDPGEGWYLDDDVDFWAMLSPVDGCIQFSDGSGEVVDMPVELVRAALLCYDTRRAAQTT
jgi:hypothetical protein